jgi:acyl carrier protein
MGEQEILNVLTRALRDLLIIVAVEMQLGIKFKVADVESFANVGEIVARIKTMLQ